MRLLERGGVGRIAVPGEPAPTMRPVNFAVHDGRIVMRTSHGALWTAALGGVGASFEFDEIRNEDHRSWNVIVTGTLAALDAVDEPAARPVKAWAPSAGGRVDRTHDRRNQRSAGARPTHACVGGGSIRGRRRRWAPEGGRGWRRRRPLGSFRTDQDSGAGPAGAGIPLLVPIPVRGTASGPGERRSAAGGQPCRGHPRGRRLGDARHRA